MPTKDIELSLKDAEIMEESTMNLTSLHLEPMVGRAGAAIPGVFTLTVTAAEFVSFFATSGRASRIISVAWGDARHHYNGGDFRLVVRPLNRDEYQVEAHIPNVRNRGVEQHVRLMTLFHTDARGKNLTEPQGQLVETGIVVLGRIRAPRNGEVIRLQYEHYTPNDLANVYANAYPADALSEVLSWGESEDSPQSL